MTPVFAISILVYSFFILAILFWYDMKIRLLPNRYVLQFFFFGIAFHIVTGFAYTPAIDATIAALSGSFLLLTIRYAGNRVYKTDTLGMGDVKLIGAAGVWLGTEYIFLSLALGALIGTIHGIFYYVIGANKTGNNVSLTELSIPAGPGFIIGIIICAIIKFHTLI